MKNPFLPSKNLISPKGQSADFIELFFDLVFVYAITRITHLTAHHLDGIHVLQSFLIFWIIWWAWTQFTWALNSANTKIPEVRLMVLIATAFAFIMASSVDYAFKEGAMWFAATYVSVRIIGLALLLRTSTKEDGQRAAVSGFALTSISGLTAVIIGALVEPDIRIYFWLAAIGLDTLASRIGSKAESWDLIPNHFSERHSLIVIIALGESLIVAASAVSSQVPNVDLILVGTLAVIVTCLLWWSYFSWISEFIEHSFAKKKGSIQARMGRDAYSFMHFLVIGGIIGIAVAFEKILAHPDVLLKASVAAALALGYLSFVGFSAAAVWRTGKVILFPRIAISLLAFAGILLSIGQNPRIALVIVATSLLLLNIIEWKRCKSHPAPSELP